MPYFCIFALIVPFCVHVTINAVGDNETAC